MSDQADLVESAPKAAAWRRRVACAIDVVAALAVFSLFLTPVTAAQGHGPTAASFLRVLAWAYLGVFVVLAVSWVWKKRRQRQYVTIGMSIMGLRPVRLGQATRMVHVAHVPGAATGLSRRVAAAVGMPLIVAAIGLLIYELIVYA